MREKLLEIIKTHPNLDHKEMLMKDVESMFEQIRQLRLENRGMTEQLNQIKNIVKS